MSKKYYRLAIYILILWLFSQILLLSCVTPKKPLTRDEYLSLRKEYDESRTRYYSGVSSEEIMNAIDKLFQETDKGYSASWGENSCIMTRSWTKYLFVSMIFGTDYWYISIESSENQKKVVIRQYIEGVDFMGMTTFSSKGGAGVQLVTLPAILNPDIIDEFEMRKNVVLYYLFFKRLDYFLGKSEEYFDCNIAYKYQERKDNHLNELIINPLESLCTFNFNESKTSLDILKTDDRPR